MPDTKKTTATSPSASTGTAATSAAPIKVSDVEISRSGTVSVSRKNRFKTDFDTFEYSSTLTKTLLTGKSLTEIAAEVSAEIKSEAADMDVLAIGEWCDRYVVNHKEFAYENQFLLRAVRWYSESNPGADKELMSLTDLGVLVERGYFSLANLLTVLWPEYYRMKRESGAKTYEVFDLIFAEEFTNVFRTIISTSIPVNIERAAEILTRFELHDKTWGALVPLSSSPPALPYEGFSPTITRIVESVAASIDGVTPDMILGTVFATAAAATAGTVWLQVKDDWVTPLNAHCLVLSESSAGKSPAMNKITRSLMREEMQINEEDAKWREERDIMINFLTKEIQNVERQMFKKKDKDETAPPTKPSTHSVADAAKTVSASAEELASLTRKLNALKRRTLQHTTVYEDITPAVFVRKLGNSWTNACNILSSETDLFEHASARVTASGSPMTKFLTAMSGEGVVLDRQHDNTEIRIERASCVVSIMTQPGPFDRYIRSNPDALEKGLISRFALVYPKKRKKTFNERPVPPAVQRDWDDAIVRLRRSAHKFIKDRIYEQQEVNKELESPNPDQYIEPRLLTVPKAVRDKWQAWRSSFLPQAEEGRDFYPIQSWMNKVDSKPLVIAAIATLLDNPIAEEISPVYIDPAIELYEVLKHHALYVMSNRDDVFSLEAFNEIVSLYRDERTTPVTKRELHVKLKSRHWMKASNTKMQPSKILDDVLSELEQSGYIKVIEDQRKGRGAKKQFIYVRPFELD